MRIAIYSLTRDRLAYSKICFASLRQNAGMPFDHYVFDNGSTDGTVQWLEDEANNWSNDDIRLCVSMLPFNAGISKASNSLLHDIFQGDYSLIIKADNDAYVRTPNILPQICEVAAAAGENWILSPRVSGINKQPTRHRTVQIAGHPVGVTPIVGGLFHVLPAAVYRRYMDAGGFPENLPLAKGQDDHLCHWFKTMQRGQCGYIEDLEVEHYEGTDAQARRYPEYFSRKFREETVTPGK